MSLKLILGPMYSGKSFELIKTIRELKILDLPYMVVKPKIDDRYTKEDFICTHNMDKERCICLSDMNDIYKYKLTEYKFIIIDEGQFISNLVSVTKNLVDNYGLNVVIAGLDGNFKREPIGDILQLVPFSEVVIKNNSKCIKCKDRTEAPFTFKTSLNNDVIDVGSVNKYIPLCRKHYIESTLLKNSLKDKNINININNSK
tara:strand:- start:103 stop:705 length:603 start_codon:yes stop_codon:yes gene_type:complete